MGSYKSAGPNGFKPIVMKHFGPRALGCINQQGTSLLSFVKDYYGEAGSFRPIYLTKFLFKTMEHVIEWSFCEHAKKIGQISDMQHAYSGTRGTDTALSTLVNLIESAILRKQLCLVISVEIQGAFDNLAFMAIEKVMGDNNYPPYMIRWYMNFFLKQDYNC